jgi:hypothetical protein
VFVVLIGAGQLRIDVDGGEDGTVTAGGLLIFVRVNGTLSIMTRSAVVVAGSMPVTSTAQSMMLMHVVASLVLSVFVLLTGEAGDRATLGTIDAFLTAILRAAGLLALVLMIIGGGLRL